MNKKFFPLIILLAAALLFFWVKKNQSGYADKRQEKSKGSREAQESFDRNIKTIVYSKHARCRMACRFIDESEVKEILETGILNTDKIEVGSKGKSYPLEGRTHDGQLVRIVYAPKQDKLVVVTVIDLENEYACNCN